MSFTGLEAFDTTMHKTSVWLDEMMHETHCGDKRRAYQELRAVLHALRDRLTMEEAVNLGAQLPMLVRGFYYEGWHPSGKPLKYRTKEEFLEHVGRELPRVAPEDLEKISEAVFKVISHHIDEGEVIQARNQLPSAVRELWH
jgi:uncharacterized protein (DUF2267 family)